MLCLLSALSLCPWWVAHKYGSISRFKGVFSGFWAFRVGLCCLGALRGLCGFCTRVELGGFMACCVFAFLLSFCLSPFAFRFISLLLLFVLLCFGCLLLVLLPCLVCSCVLVVFVVVSFSLSDYAQKERAQRFCSLRPLFVCRERSNSCNVIEELRCCFFGSF